MLDIWLRIGLYGILGEPTSPLLQTPHTSDGSANDYCCKSPLHSSSHSSRRIRINRRPPYASQRIQTGFFGRCRIVIAENPSRKGFMGAGSKRKSLLYGSCRVRDQNRSIGPRTPSRLPEFQPRLTNHSPHIGESVQSWLTTSAHSVTLQTRIGAICDLKCGIMAKKTEMSGSSL